MFLLLVGW